MQKIPTLFVRDEQTRLVTPQVNEGCEWVLEGLGTATIKVDGSCCMVRDGVLYRRYTSKAALSPLEAQTIGFIPSDDDGEAGHRHGWIPVGASPNDRYHREAWDRYAMKPPNWTYELVGPKVQGNPYKLADHQLWMHGYHFVEDAPRTFAELKSFLADFTEEGIVWWLNINDPNAPMVKIKRRDFGLPWPVR